MRYIPLKENPPPKKWRDKAKELTKQLLNLPEERRQSFINSRRNRKLTWGSKKLVNHLKKLSYGKCWYSEAREVYSYYHVDHFRPKSEYWWLAFDWKNYRLAGQVGNVNKRDKFKVLRHKAKNPDDPIEDEIYYLLDPTDENDPLLLFFDESGEAVPSDKDNEFNKKRAEYTIEVLKLNYEPLKEVRRLVWRKCKKLIDEIKDLYKNPTSATNRAKIKEKIKQLKELLEPEQEFTAVAQCCIYVHGGRTFIRLIGG